MRRLLFLLVFLAAPALWGQASNPSVRYVATPPSGTCAPAPPIQIIDGTGVIWGCVNPGSGYVWTALTTGASGSGTVSPGTQYAVPCYSATGTGTTLGTPCGLTSDAVGDFTAGNLFTNNVLGTLSNLEAQSCTGPQLTNGNNGWCVDNAPSTCSVLYEGSTVNYTTQIDCADRLAEAELVATGTSQTLILGPKNYLTNVGVEIAPNSYTGSSGVSIVGVAPWLSGIQSNAIPTSSNGCNGTVCLGTPTGGGNNPKRFSIRNITINGNWQAPDAFSLLGYHYESDFANIYMRNGVYGNLIQGNGNNIASWGYQDHWINIWGIKSGCAITGGCGTGLTATVALSGGVPTVTVTAGGTNYDTNTQLWLAGFQNGTALNPCTTMGTLSFTTSSNPGPITAITASGFSGCSGNVYLHSDDESQNVGMNFTYETDSTFENIISQSGYQSGFKIANGANSILHLHSFPVSGKFCVQNAGSNSYQSFEMGECQDAELDLFGNGSSGPVGIATLDANQYTSNDASTETAKAMFRLENTVNKVFAHDIPCQSINTYEFHTLVTPNGVWDSNGVNANGDLLTNTGSVLNNVGYCGSNYNGTNTTTSGSTSAGSTTLVVASGTGSTNGEAISASGLAVGTTIASGAGTTTLTLSSPTVASMSNGTAVQFGVGTMNATYVPLELPSLTVDVGGIVVGNPTGGNLGVGTENVSGGYYVNGASFTPISVQVNGSALSSPTPVNFVAGTNVTLTNTSAGNISITASSTAASAYSGLTAANNTNTGVFEMSGGQMEAALPGAASTSAFLVNSTPYAGTGTTSYPSQLITWGTFPSITNWNTAGTGLGIAEPSGSTADLFNMFNGTTSEAKLSSAGALSTNGNIISGGVVSGTGITASSASNNLYISNVAGLTGTGTGQFQYGGSSAVDFRIASGGGSATLSGNYNYANLLIAATPITTPASGTHGWLSNFAVNPMGTVTSGGATVTNTATAYFGTNTASIGGTNYPGIYSAGGYATSLSGRYDTTHGSNATAGVVTLASGTATVSTTAIAALASAGGSGDVVLLSLQSCSNCGALSVGTVTGGTSFVINSTSNTDASNVYWEIKKLN